MSNITEAVLAILKESYKQQRVSGAAKEQAGLAYKRPGGRVTIVRRAFVKTGTTKSGRPKGTYSGKPTRMETPRTKGMRTYSDKEASRFDSGKTMQKENFTGSFGMAGPPALGAPMKKKVFRKRKKQQNKI